jgi:heme-degrading monooxygenase HmoA
MPVKILIKRKFKTADFTAISKALRQARLGAMEQEGYISSETLWDYDDPCRVVVASMWQSLDHWNRYNASETRKTSETLFDEMLTVPAEYEYFALGLYPHAVDS